ncbi:MAG: HAMP domain-containing histidine kinase [Deltaproteobacteria bacterium]|nr:HAMP domain-containing histidine kinase [Deltaproteobacteria bacterium]
MIERRTQLVVQLVVVLSAGTAVVVFGRALTPAATLFLLVATAVGISLSARGRAGRAVRADDAARRLKSELLSNVSHELRTPLNAILGYAEILETIPEISTVERQQIVVRILSNAMALTCAVNNLLEYSTVAAGVGELRSGTVRLAELFDELEPWVGRLLDEKPVAFSWVADADLPTLETDRSKLRQVVLNLLANAAKFTAAGEIRLSARRADDDAGIEIAVTDTGVGMSASEQGRIFEDFRQLSGSTTRPFGGIGLGLTLARRLCELLGASIAVESAPAKGTRVAVRLPAIAPFGRGVMGLEARASA